jgi:phosphatidylinositol alpha-1,6-mannosyltransferase
MFEVVHLVTGLDGPDAGGVQETARLAWAAVQQRACGAALLCYGHADCLRGEEANGHVLVAARRPALLGKVLARRWQARVFLVWHVGLLKLLPVLRTRSARVVLFLHGIEVWKRFGPWTRRLLRRVDLFLSNSAFTWQRFTEMNPEFAAAPHRVVHLGVEGEAPAADLPTGPPAALMLGRLARAEAYKGHAEVIAAWPQVRDRVPGAELWVAGDGDLRPDLEARAAAAGLAGAVRFCGRVPEPRKQELLHRCRCLALPSRGEGFGLVYLEAMQLGRPCLVSDCDAGREVVHPPEAGLAADPGNAAELAAALARLLTAGPEWERWSAAARRRYADHFTAAQYQQRLLEAVLGPAPAEAP